MNEAQTELDLTAAPPSAVSINPLLNPIPPEVLTIIGYMYRNCRGPQHIASAKELAAHLGLEGSDPARRVRHLIELYLDRLPFIIVGVPGSGYYVTDDPVAMARYEATLHSILQAAARKISTFRRLAASHGYTRTGSAPHSHYRKERQCQNH